MKNKKNLSKILAVAGTSLIWLPVILTLLFAIIGSIARGRLLVDYLLPAELFLVVLLGGILILIAAIITKSYLKLIGWGLGIAVVSLVIGQVIASVSGLSSGDMEPTGMIFGLVLASLVIYILALIEMAIAGLLLTGKLFAKSEGESN